MIQKTIIYILVIAIITSCSKDNSSSEGSKFNACFDLLYPCDSTGDYCLFGFKWGEQSSFSNTGVNVEGPKSEGGVVTFSLQEKQAFVSNHLQEDFPTDSFFELPECAIESISRAFADWSSVANITLEELPMDSESDIKVFVADMEVGAVGFPNFTTAPCQQIAGHVIIDTPDSLLADRNSYSCISFHALMLHEIGHALGLGHSSEENIMGSIRNNLDGLQEGDIKGIQQLYGE